MRVPTHTPVVKMVPPSGHAIALMPNPSTILIKSAPNLFVPMQVYIYA